MANAVADNASFEEDGSVQKARAYVTALLVWKNRWAFDESELGPSRMRFDQITRTLPADLAYARSWIASQPATSATTAYAGYSKVSLAGGRE